MVWASRTFPVQGAQNYGPIVILTESRIKLSDVNVVANLLRFYDYNVASVSVQHITHHIQAQQCHWTILDQLESTWLGTESNRAVGSPCHLQNLC